MSTLVSSAARGRGSGGEARGAPEDWRGGRGHIRPYIGGGTGGAELGDQRRLVTGRLRPAVKARAHHHIETTRVPPVLGRQSSY